MAEEANSGGKQFAVKLFDFVIDGKAGKKMVTEMAKIAPELRIAMLSYDPAKGKTNCYLSVGKDALAKVKAGDWAKAIIAKVGAGKGGNRELCQRILAIDAAEAAAQGAGASANEFSRNQRSGL